MPKHPKHSVSVAAAVVRDDGKVLVIRRRDNGHWEPPGGVLELDEGVLEGLRREVLEETGLTVEPQRLTGVYKNMARGIIALMFRARPTGGHLDTSDETSNVEWWSAEQVSDQMTRAYAVRILDALREDGPAIRLHDGISLLVEAEASPS